MPVFPRLALAQPTGLGPTQTPVVEIEQFNGVSATRSDSRGEDAKGRIAIPEGDPGRFSVPVDGDCMEPNYRHGESVIFSPRAFAREGIIDGKDYFLRIDDETTFKRVFRHPDTRDILILKTWNPKYLDREVERSQVQSIAKAVGKYIPVS